MGNTAARSVAWLGVLLVGAVRAAYGKVTVIIPLYNGAWCIERALHSVLRQTRAADEIVVVDDGSSDDGLSLARRIAGDDPRFVFLSQKNAGQSAARNAAARAAKGTLLAFLDQDDWWYPDHLEKLEGPFLIPRYDPLGWSYSDLDEFDAEGRLVTRRMLSQMAAGHPKRSLAQCLRENMFVVPSATLLNRDAFHAVGGFDGQLTGYEDDDLFLRMFRAGFGNEFLPEALTAWRIHGGSSSYSPRMLRSARVYALKLLRDYPDDKKLRRWYSRDLIAPRFIKTALGSLRAAMESGNKEIADESLRLVDTLIPYLRPGLSIALRICRPFMQIPAVARTVFALGLHRLVWKVIE
jgi:glycosyltransferase involved in cell wall biosynthesis